MEQYLDLLNWFEADFRLGHAMSIDDEEISSAAD